MVDGSIRRLENSQFMNWPEAVFPCFLFFFLNKKYFRKMNGLDARLNPFNGLVVKVTDITL